MDIPRYEQIFNHLLQKIREGELKEGERVPSEKELADQFNVSRITSKKALELLAQNKLIERIQGKGSFVANAAADWHKIKTQRQPDGSDEKNKNNNEERLVGVILPDFADSFGADLVRGIEEQCSKHGCHMIMKLTYDNREEEEAAVRSLTKLGVDGIIVFPGHGEHYNSELLRLVLDRFPLVLIDRYLKGIAASAVFTDNRKAAFDLTNKLLDKSIRPVGFLSPPADHTSSIEDRLLGYSDACIQKGWTPKPDHIMTNLYSSLPSLETPNFERDFDTVRKYVEMNPELTAFVVSEYNLALVLREVLLSSGKRIPDDYQIVCFDSPRQSLSPDLFTHVRQNQLEIGRKAVQLLISMWNDEETALNHVVDFEIIQGLSSLA
ncbi:GntR family transcriptional regulator [Paenibacillus thermotolerans]|uniref:GntR family transcriptional regulator n=1 Tax=Paenibacillus thermotolerans TaxID=3027807 RepID=UPI0023684238|nr:MULTISPECIES: GntR family transcriptional regulator [unclassified Paenibacillus]